MTKQKCAAVTLTLVWVSSVSILCSAVSSLSLLSFRLVSSWEHCSCFSCSLRPCSSSWACTLLNSCRNTHTKTTSINLQKMNLLYWTDINILGSNGVKALVHTCCLSCKAFWAVSRWFSKSALWAFFAASADNSISVLAFS